MALIIATQLLIPENVLAHSSGSTPVQLDVVEVVHVVERSDTDATFAKGFVDDAHVRFAHVVKVNFDGTFLRVADDFDLVPRLIFPRCFVFVFGHGFAWSILHDHDLPAVRVGVCPKVTVVKMLGILPVKKHATVAMSPGVLSAFHVECQHEVGDVHIFDESYVIGTADFWLIVTVASIDPKDVVAVDLAMGPAFFVRDLPSFVSLLEVLLEYEREFFF